MKIDKQKPTRLGRAALFLYNHVFLSASLWISLFVFGLLSYTVFMQRQGFPTVEVPVSVVNAVYFVDNKAKVDTDIAKPVSDVIKELPEVKSVRSSSFNNQASIVVEYNEGTSSREGSGEVEQAVQTKLKLPPSADLSYQPIDAARFNNKYDVLLSVSSDGKSAEELQSAAIRIAGELKAKVPAAQTVNAVPLFEEAVNPSTGKTEKQQVRFDWKGDQAHGSLSVLPSVVIGIQTSDDEDVLAFDKTLSEAIVAVSAKPDNQEYRITKAAGFAESISGQIISLQRNLLEGLLIVALICLIFIGVRAGLLAALGMLMTLTVTLGILFLSGVTLNTITLFGLVLCLGLIVDDTIIMIEAIDAERKRKKPLPDAIRIAIKKIALASAAGTFTTMLGFAPLLFISGILGEFIRILPITIIISLAVSLVVSILFIPFMSRWFLGRPAKPDSRKNPLTYPRLVVDGLGNLVARLILGAQTRKQKILRTGVAILISFTLIGLTGVLFQKIKFDIFPTPKDSDAVQVSYTFSPGTSVEGAQSITKAANQVISDTLGANVEKITYLGNADNRQATANVTLVSYKDRDVTAKQLVEDLQEGVGSFAGARIIVSQVSAGPPKDQFPFRVQIPAENTEQAYAVAQRMASFLKDKSIARPNGTTAKINEVEYTGELTSITRIDGRRSVEVRASFDAEDTSALVQATETMVRDDFFTPKNLGTVKSDDIGFDFGNESDNQESFSAVLVALPLLIIAMYVLLALQFRSFFQPLLILIAVPFSFFGVASALIITDNPFSFFVMIAFFALIGISVNNSILLTDYANQARRSGLSPRQAMAGAVQQRIRPLVTTSLTSILALLPLALSDPFWESLAVTLIGGLAASALLVVISFPYFYLILEAIRSRVQLKFKK